MNCIDIIDYIYYRMSNFYDDEFESKPYVRGSIVLFGCLASNILTILSAILFIFKIKMSIMIIHITLGVALLLNIFYRSEEKYLKLCTMYKDENHKKLKGWLVFAYFLCSVIIYIISCFIFK